MAYSEQTDWTTEPQWDLVRRRGLGVVVALLLEAIIIFAILSLSMRSGGPAAGTRGLNTFSLEAEADSASSADKNETKTPVTKEQQQTITPPIPKPASKKFAPTAATAPAPISLWPAPAPT